MPTWSVLLLPVVFDSLVLPGVSSSFSSCPCFPFLSLCVISTFVCPAPNVLTCASLSLLPKYALSTFVCSHCFIFLFLCESFMSLHVKALVSISLFLGNFAHPFLSLFVSLQHFGLENKRLLCETCYINVETIEEFSARGMSEQSMGLGVY